MGFPTVLFVSKSSPRPRSRSREIDHETCVQFSASAIIIFLSYRYPRKRIEASSQLTIRDHTKGMGQWIRLATTAYQLSARIGSVWVRSIRSLYPCIRFDDMSLSPIGRTLVLRESCVVCRLHCSRPGVHNTAFRPTPLSSDDIDPTRSGSSGRAGLFVQSIWDPGSSHGEAKSSRVYQANVWRISRKLQSRIERDSITDLVWA